MNNLSTDEIFKSNYSTSVLIDYVVMGTKLRNTVRRKNAVQGASTEFHHLADGPDGSVIPAPDRDPVTCKLHEYSAGYWCDTIGEARIDSHEFTIISRAGAYMIGRKSDELIINALDYSTNTPENMGIDHLTNRRVDMAIELISEADVPSGDNRYAIVGWKQWSDLLQIDSFTASRYLDDDELPWKGTQAKRWKNTIWMPHSGLTKVGVERYCYMYYESAVGHAAGDTVTSSMTWHQDRGAHFINNTLSQGATIINPNGVVPMRCSEK